MADNDTAVSALAEQNKALTKALVNSNTTLRTALSQALNAALTPKDQQIDRVLRETDRANTDDMPPVPPIGGYSTTGMASDNGMVSVDVPGAGGGMMGA